MQCGTGYGANHLIDAASVGEQAQMQRLGLGKAGRRRFLKHLKVEITRNLSVLADIKRPAIRIKLLANPQRPLGTEQWHSSGPWDPWQ